MEQVICEITRRCNYHCPFCYCLWHEPTQPMPKEISLERWQEILSQIPQEVRYITLTGGEPTLRKDWREIASYARQYHPRTTITLFTNCSRMSEESFAFLKQHKIRMATSLPGLAAYSTMTGTRRSSRNVLEWIARGKEMKWGVGVNLTIAKPNQQEALEMLAAVVVAGAAAVSVVPMMCTGRAMEHTHWMLSEEEWHTLKEQLKKVATGKCTLSFGDEMHCACRHKKPGECIPEGCPAGKRLLVYGPDGIPRKCLHLPNGE